jgi:hypothetical protein
MFGDASDQSGLQSLEPLLTLDVSYNPQSIPDLTIPPTGNVLGTGRLCWSLSPEPSVVDHSMYADQAEIDSSSSQALWNGLHNGLMDGYMTNQSIGTVPRGTTKTAHLFVDGPPPIDGGAGYFGGGGGASNYWIAEHTYIFTSPGNGGGGSNFVGRGANATSKAADNQAPGQVVLIFT